MGRKLLPGECVHHIDFDKSNNSPDNLYVCASNEEHMALRRSLNTAMKDVIDEGLITFNGVEYV